MDDTNTLVLAEKEVGALSTKLEKAVAYAEKVTIKTDADQENVVKALVGIETEEKRIDEQRKFFTDPLNEQVKKINAMFKPFVNGLGDAANTLRKKMSAYQMAIAAKADKARDKALADLKSGKIKNVEAAVAQIEKVKEPEKTVRTEAATVTYKDKIGFEISDAAAIPREYLMPDEKKILKVVQAGIEISGVKKTIEKIPTVKAN
jgi:hypothetical protein